MKFLIGGNAASAQTSPTAPTADAVRFRNRQSKSEWERRAGNGFLLCVFLARSFRLGRAFFYAFPSVGNAFAERKFVVPRNFSCRRRKEAFFMGRNLTLKITFSAVAAALTFVATVFIRVPSVDGGYTNLSDAIIFLTAALLGPVPAMLAGGLGTFFADLYVYPATMFYSLVIHGLEGLFCGLLLKLIHSKCRNSKLEPLLGGAAMALCGLFMAGMYFLAKWLFYGTWASALVSLPRNLIQAGLSVVLAVVAVYIVKLPSLLKKQGVNVGTDKTSAEDVSSQNGEISSTGNTHGQ